MKTNEAVLFRCNEATEQLAKMFDDSDNMKRKPTWKEVIQLGNAISDIRQMIERHNEPKRSCLRCGCSNIIDVD